MPVKKTTKAKTSIFSNLYLFVFLVIFLIFSLYSFYTYFAEKPLFDTKKFSDPTLSGNTADTIKPNLISKSLDFNFTASDYNNENLKTIIKDSYSKGETLKVTFSGSSYRLPNFLSSKTSEKSRFFNLTPVLSYDIQLNKALNEQDAMFWGRNSLNLYKVAYTKSIKDWLSENVSYQGIGWGDSRLGGEKFSMVNINGLDYTVVNAGCCGGTELLYLIKTPNSILIFSSDHRPSFYSGQEGNDRSFLIESVLQSVE